MSDYGDEDFQDIDDAGLEVEIDNFEDEEATEEASEVVDIKDAVENTVKKNAKKIQNSDRSTRPVLTKYERVIVLSHRTRELDLGCKPFTDIGVLKNTYDIALKELEERKIPYIVRRHMPNNYYEDWELNELIY